MSTIQEEWSRFFIRRFKELVEQDKKLKQIEEITKKGETVQCTVQRR